MKVFKIFLLLILTAHIKSGYCQDTIAVGSYPKEIPFNINSPRLRNLGIFKTELPYKEIKGIYDSLLSSGAFSVYIYIFQVDKRGIVIPGKYKKSTLFNPLKGYIVGKFNNYRWLPAHKKRCKTCNVSAIMEMCIYLRTDIKRVHIKMNMISITSTDNVYDLDISKEVGLISQP